MDTRRKIEKNRRLFREAQKYLVGGVNSPVRSFSSVGAEPVLIKDGKGAYVRDYDSNRYIDYVLSWGALILGHAHPSVIDSVKDRAGQGVGFGSTSKEEIELARLIHEAIPHMEKVRFVNSGTEAVMSAVRLARGYTGRDIIVKFERSYHGHADYLLKNGGSGLAALNTPSVRGVPEAFLRHTIVAPFGNQRRIEEIFNSYGNIIAAVIVEPVGGNYGVVPPDAEFLIKLRKLTKRHKSLLIFDEVITGFRFDFGAAASRFGIMPDLTCLGKIIGGGLPVGACGGRKEIMNMLAPVGNVYQASTFGGNPVVMSAGIATLRALKKMKNDYRRIARLAEYLAEALRKEARLRGVKAEINYYGSMFSLRFWKKIDFNRFHKDMLKRGVYLAPSQFEANFLSFSHTQKEINKTVAAAREVIKRL